MRVGEIVFILLALAFLLWRVRRANRPKGPAR